MPNSGIRLLEMLLIDDRVGSVELAPKITGIPCELCRLPYGDFAFFGSGPKGPASIGVERKRVLDLLSSISSGRFSGHQLIGLLDCYDFVYVVVEGNWRPHAKTGMLQIPRREGWSPAELGGRTYMAREFFNFINTLQIVCGVHVVFTHTLLETVQWLQASYKWWSKEWPSHKSHLQFQATEKFSLVKPTLTARVAAQFPGVGPKHARKIGERFSSPAEFLSATMEDLTKIKGIGTVLAGRILKAMNGI